MKNKLRSYEVEIIVTTACDLYSMAVTTDIAIATSAQDSFTCYAQRRRTVCGSCNFQSTGEESIVWRSEAFFLKGYKGRWRISFIAAFNIMFECQAVNHPSRHKLFHSERPVLHKTLPDCLITAAQRKGRTPADTAATCPWKNELTAPQTYSEFITQCRLGAIK